MKKLHRVLVVEEDIFHRKMLKKNLRALPGLRVDQTKSTEEALALIEKGAYDIIICDIDISGQDGFQLCRHLKSDSDSEMSDIYLIVVNPGGAKNDKIKSRNEGADDYVKRPVDPDELIASMRVGKRISSQLKKPRIDAPEMFEGIDVLLVQDGGCAPG